MLNSLRSIKNAAKRQPASCLLFHFSGPTTFTCEAIPRRLRSGIPPYFSHLRLTSNRLRGHRSFARGIVDICTAADEILLFDMTDFAQSNRLYCVIRGHETIGIARNRKGGLSPLGVRPRARRAARDTNLLSFAKTLLRIPDELERCSRTFILPPYHVHGHHRGMFIERDCKKAIGK